MLALLVPMVMLLAMFPENVQMLRPKSAPRTSEMGYVQRNMSLCAQFQKEETEEDLEESVYLLKLLRMVVLPVVQ